MHSSETTDPSILRDKHVVVIGGSKSATDICVQALAQGAKQVHMVYRRDARRVPYRVAGLINFKHLFFTRFQEAQYRDWAPRGLGAAVMRVARPLNMGATRRNTGWLRECFSYPRADKYEACLASAPNYLVG